MLDLTKTLLRLLEFMALHLPHTFLAPACAINLTRWACKEGRGREEEERLQTYHAVFEAAVLPVDAPPDSRTHTLPRTALHLILTLCGLLKVTPFVLESLQTPSLPLLSLFCRLMEVIPFVLGHFTSGPDARRLNELLQASQQMQGLPQTLMRLGADRQYTVIHVDKPLFEKV